MAHNTKTFISALLCKVSVFVPSLGLWWCSERSEISRYWPLKGSVPGQCHTGTLEIGQLSLNFPLVSPRSPGRSCFVTSRSGGAGEFISSLWRTKVFVIRLSDHRSSAEVNKLSWCKNFFYSLQIESSFCVEAFSFLSKMFLQQKSQYWKHPCYILLKPLTMWRRHHSTTAPHL